jgi:hypothetical protein
LTLITSNFCREQEGQAIKLTPFWRKLSDFKISNPTLISSTDGLTHSKVSNEDLVDQLEMQIRQKLASS